MGRTGAGAYVSKTSLVQGKDQTFARKLGRLRGSLRARHGVEWGSMQMHWEGEGTGTARLAVTSEKE